MIETGFLGLYCDGEACTADEYQEVHFLEDGFQLEYELRDFAARHGWTIVRNSGSPWRSEDFCPACKPQTPPTPEEVIEIRG